MKQETRLGPDSIDFNRNFVTDLVFCAVFVMAQTGAKYSVSKIDINLRVEILPWPKPGLNLAMKPHESCILVC